MNKARKYGNLLGKLSLMCILLGIVCIIVAEIIITEQTALRYVFQTGAALLLMLLLLFFTGMIILLLYSDLLDAKNNYRLRLQQKNEEKAKERETAKDYSAAIKIWEKLGEIKEAARVRTLKAEQGSVKVAQKVVQGDEISKTEIKDSVVSKSNIGAGGKSKAEELREAKSLLDEGLINEDDYEKMKKEILGK